PWSPTTGLCCAYDPSGRTAFRLRAESAPAVTTDRRRATPGPRASGGPGGGKPGQPEPARLDRPIGPREADPSVHEEPSDVLGLDGRRPGAVTVDDLSEQLGLACLELHHLLLDRVRRDEAVHVDTAVLPDAVR